MPVVTLTVGRSLSVEQKLLYGETVYAAMVASLHVAAHDKMIRIILREIKPENWGLRGGIAGCDL